MPTTYTESIGFDGTFNGGLPVDVELGDTFGGKLNYTMPDGAGGYLEDTTDTIQINVVEGVTYTFKFSAEVYGIDSSIYISADGVSTPVTSTGADGFTGEVTFTATFTGPTSLSITSTSAEAAYDISLVDVVLPLPTEGDDNLTGNMTSDRVDLLGGDDIYSALGGSDIVTGGTGNDFIDGVCGNDRLFGDEGNDTLLGGNGRDIIFGGADDDLLDGQNQEDSLNGEAGNDKLLGDKGNDTLDGGTGKDTLNGGTDNDLLTGGADADTFLFRRGDGQDIITDFTQGSDLIDLTMLRVWDISQLSIQEAGTGVRINTGDGNYIELTGLTEGALTNADFILDSAPVITVSEGSDTITGTSGDDVFFAAGGSDRIMGGAGADTLDGGTGKDTLHGGDDNDLITGGSGADHLRGDGGNDTIYGEADNDKLEGNDGDDYLDGGNANDRLYGGSGQDTLIGENGNDQLWGGDGADTLNGGAGKDKLLGDDGADVLIGGWGDDTLTGGADADIFVFDDDRTRADVITDFEDGIDTVRIAGYGYTDVSDLAMAQLGADVVITLSLRDSITIENTILSALDNSDFDLLL